MTFRLPSGHRCPTNAEKGIGFNVTTNTTNARPDRWTDGPPLTARYPHETETPTALVRARREGYQCQFAAADLSSIINNSHSHVINDIGLTSGMGI